MVQGTVVFVDFTGLHERECQGVKNAGSPDSDYEHFTPSDGRAGDECFLGHKISYTRRKRDKECYNGVHHERGVKIHDCECADQDWECDIGYARRVDGGVCLRAEGVNITAFLQPYCPVSGHYTMTDGYRKVRSILGCHCVREPDCSTHMYVSLQVAGDTCKGGLQHHSTKVKCSHWGHLSGFGKFVLFLVLALVCAMGCVTYSQSQQNGGSHSVVHELVDIVLTYVPLLRKILIVLHRLWEKVSIKASALSQRFVPAKLRKVPVVVLSHVRTLLSKIQAILGKFTGSGSGSFGGGLGGRVNNATYAQIGQAKVDSALDYAENLDAADFDDDDTDSDIDDDIESAELFDSSRSMSEALGGANATTNKAT